MVDRAVLVPDHQYICIQPGAASSRVWEPSVQTIFSVLIRCFKMISSPLRRFRLNSRIDWENSVCIYQTKNLVQHHECLEKFGFKLVSFERRAPEGAAAEGGRHKGNAREETHVMCWTPVFVFALWEKHGHSSGDRTENREEQRAPGKWQNLRKGGEEEQRVGGIHNHL